MNPAHLIPLPDPLHVHWGWLQLLLTSTFILHLLAMNIMLGWAIIAFCRHAFSPAPLAESRLVAGKLPFTIAFTVNFGVAPLLFLQVLYGHFMYTSSILMAVYWLAIVGLLLAAYSAAYLYYLQFTRLHGLHTLITGIIMLLLLVITFFFTSNMSLMATPESWTRYFDHPEGMLLNFADPTLIPRYLHSVLASVAVGGLALGLYYDWQVRRGDQQAAALIPGVMNWFVVATIANFGIGTWYFGGQPASIRTVTGVTGGLLLAFLLAGIAAAILSLIYGLQRRVRHTAGAVLGAIVCMALVRELVRRQTLAPWFSTSELEVVPQYSPLLLFLLVLAAGLYLVWWMIRLTLSGDKEARS